MSNWLAGKVIENHHWSDKLYSLKVKVENYPSFTPGQFTRIGLKLDDKLVGRPYSLVNSPQADYLEFYSIVVEEGELSPPLHELEEGDTIYVSDLVTGFLVLDEVPQEHTKIWLMATGTGLGPFLSMLGSNEIWERFESIVLVHGVRLASELTYADYVKELMVKHPTLQYVPFVSREETDFAINGRIPAALQNNELEQKAGLKMDPADTHIMLCGNPAMLKDVQEVMADKGFQRNRRRTPGHITTENYW